MRRAAALTFAALLFAAAPARAEEVTAAQLRELASRAAMDPVALERLRRVDRVEGRPADIGSALRGAGAKEAAERLAQLEPDAGAGTGGDPRARAREVLGGRRYRGTDVPRPFAGAIEWIGARVRPVLELIGDGFRALARAIPGGEPMVWALLALVVIALAALVGRQEVRRRAALIRAPSVRAAEAERPRDLERAADAAERDGRWEEAVRLRFRAGVLRLEQRRVLQHGSSMTTGEVAGTLGLEPFERLGRRFDAIAYGAREATAEDAGGDRADWAEVLAAAGPR